VQNLLTVGVLMTRAALARNESRGTHQRTDAPATDPAQAHHLSWTIDRMEPAALLIGAAAGVSS